MTGEFEPLFNRSAEDKAFEPLSVENPKLDPPEEDIEAINFALECERLRTEAHSQGYDAGYAEAKHEIDALKAELQGIIAQFKDPMQRLDEHIRDEIVQTIFFLCEALIGVELSAKPEKVQAIFTKLEQVLPSLKEPAILWMHPADIEAIKAHVPEDIWSSLVLFEPDENLSRGSYILKHAKASVDGRIDARLRDAFLEFKSEDLS